MNWVPNMKQLLVDTMLFSVTPRQLNESIAKNDGKVIVSGVNVIKRHQFLSFIVIKRTHIFQNFVIKRW
jgi:hypothetical protein